MRPRPQALHRQTFIRCCRNATIATGENVSSPITRCPSALNLASRNKPPVTEQGSLNTARSARTVFPLYSLGHAIVVVRYILHHCPMANPRPPTPVPSPHVPVIQQPPRRKPEFGLIASVQNPDLLLAKSLRRSGAP